MCPGQPGAEGLSATVQGSVGHCWGSLSLEIMSGDVFQFSCCITLWMLPFEACRIFMIHLLFFFFPHPFQACSEHE